MVGVKGPPRRFDHDECRALYATGEWTQKALAEKYGVSPSRVCQIVNPKVANRIRAYQDARQSSVCSECGRPCSWNRYQQERPRCRTCSFKALAKVRDGQAYCPSCLTWKVLADFSRDASRPGRGVCGECRSCSTERRRDWRRLHPDRDRAAARRYRARLRDAQKAAA